MVINYNVSRVGAYLRGHLIKTFTVSRLKLFFFPRGSASSAREKFSYQLCKLLIRSALEMIKSASSFIIGHDRSLAGFFTRFTRWYSIKFVMIWIKPGLGINLYIPFCSTSIYYEKNLRLSKTFFTQLLIVKKERDIYDAEWVAQSKTNVFNYSTERNHCFFYWFDFLSYAQIHSKFSTENFIRLSELISILFVLPGDPARFLEHRGFR